jgi:two-component sensor histidine kinase
VQAIARQTLAATPQDFLDRFGKRIEALAAGQDLLIKNAWKGVALDELVHSQLAPFEDLIGTRIYIQGPNLFVSAFAAQTIGMALHELATNVGKYGALLSTWPVRVWRTQAQGRMHNEGRPNRLKTRRAPCEDNGPGQACSLCERAKQAGRRNDLAPGGHRSRCSSGFD